MQRSRLIPVLLLDARRRLVKTEGFERRTYVGDPFNVIRLFNEKEVDEICLLDIDASPQGRAPDVGYLRELASECFMPLAYGGGITRMQECDALLRVGVEKFVLGRAASDSALIGEMVGRLGSQAVVACVDVRGDGQDAHCRHPDGTRQDPASVCTSLADLGVGEIILQSIDRDGSRRGYDLPLLRRISSCVSIPVIALGGAGQLDDLLDGIDAGASAAASGSAFVFLGRLRAVLVTYPHAHAIAASREARSGRAPDSSG